MARRLGRQLQLLDAGGEVHDLLTFTGLIGVVPPCSGATPPAEGAGRTADTTALCRGRT
jgi:hypothetical protein